MNRLFVGAALIGSVVVGSWLAYAITPRPVRSFIPDAAPLSSWHASAIGSLVVNREVGQ